MPDEAGPPQRLSLSVPQGTEHIGTVRAFIGAVGAHYRLGPHEIDDLKLAVSEICGDADASAVEGRIDVHVDRTDHALHVEVTGLGPARSEEGPEAETARAFRRRLIDALIPDAVFAPTDAGMAVRFTVAATD
jgi:anti-sigma regulatory factor (Ser/Thr protein kinase)